MWQHADHMHTWWHIGDESSKCCSKVRKLDATRKLYGGFMETFINDVTVNNTNKWHTILSWTCLLFILYFINVCWVKFFLRAHKTMFFIQFEKLVEMWRQNVCRTLYWAVPQPTQFRKCYTFSSTNQDSQQDCGSLIPSYWRSIR